MANEEQLDLAEAMTKALDEVGVEVLHMPNTLLGYFMDYMEPGSPQMRVLERSCDEQLLAPFEKAASSTTQDLYYAVGRVRMYLEDECMVDAAVAQAVAEAMAAGIARWRYNAGIAEDAQHAIYDSQSEDAFPEQRASFAHDIAHDIPVSRATDELAPASAQNTPVPFRRRAIVAASVVAAIAVIVFVVMGGYGGVVTPSDRVVASISNEDDGVWLLTKQKDVDSGGHTTYTDAYTYDEHGNILENKYWYDSNTIYDDKPYWYVQRYGDFDEYGHPAQKTSGSVFANGSWHGQPSEYNITYELYDDGRIKSKTSECEAAEAGQNEVGEYMSGHDAERTVEEYTYKGDLLVSTREVVTVLPQEQVSNVYTSEYNDHGDETLWKAEYTGGSTYTYEYSYEYDIAGKVTGKRLTSTEVEKDGKKSVSTSDFEFDEHGNVTKDTTVENGGEAVVMEYKNTYDENGNLVRRENLHDGSVTTYEYIYVQDPSPVAAGHIKDS